MIIPSLIRTLCARQRRHREALAAGKRLGNDEAAWSELFRRDDWAPAAAGHYGRCGQCGAQIDLSLVQCPRCGAEWRPNRRRSDLYRQAGAYVGGLSTSALLGYGGAARLRAHFDAVEAGGESVNPEMVSTLSAFTWLFCGVLAMICFTYLIERLAPIGHWRKHKPNPPQGSGRRKGDAA